MGWFDKELTNDNNNLLQQSNLSPILNEILDEKKYNILNWKKDLKH